MKIKQNFKDITISDDIPQEALEIYLNNLYNDPNYNPKDASYIEDAEPNLVVGYKKRANILIDRLKELTGNDKFEQLRHHFAADTQPGATRTIADDMKKTAEAICYKLEHNLISTPNRFKDEIKNSTINACTPGALTNMQKVLFAMDDSLYLQKYNYIQNLAIEFVNTNKLAEHQGMEVHKANELIHEVSREYKVIPPRDIHARYRILDDTPSEDFIKYAQFKDYLNKHFASREGIYSFSEFITNDHLSNLPTLKKNQTKFSVKTNAASVDNSEQFEQVNSLANKLNIPLTSFINYSEDGKEFTYKNDYQNIINAAVIQQLSLDEMIEYTPLVLHSTETIKSYASPKRTKGEDGKLKVVYDTEGTDKTIESSLPIIETPNGWYITEKLDNQTFPSWIIFDSGKLNELTYDSENYEDFLHQQLREPLAQGLGFDNSLRIIIANNSQNETIDHLDSIRALKMLSDQVKPIKHLLTIEEIGQLLENKTCPQFIKLLNDPSKSNKLLLQIIRYGDETMLNAFIHINPEKNKAKLIKWRNENLGNAIHEAVKLGNNQIIKSLKKNGLDINFQDKYGHTALHTSSTNGNTEAIKALKDTGADFNVKDNDGTTALHLAILDGHTESLKELIIAGAKISITNYYGETPIDVAAKNGIIKDIASSFTKDKIHTTKLLINIINDASNWIYDNESIWKLAEEMIKLIPQDEKLKVLTGVLEKIDNTTRRDRILNFIPEHERNLVRAQLNPTALEVLREISDKLHGHSNEDAPKKDDNSNNSNQNNEISNKNSRMR